MASRFNSRSNRVFVETYLQSPHGERIVADCFNRHPSGSGENDVDER